MPIRARVHVLLALLGLLAIAGLLAAHHATQRPDAAWPGELWPAFDLAARSSLATWFRSALLAAAGVTAVLIYLVRRHKTDDYRGVYRLWLWGAVCCGVASADATAGLSETLGRVMNAVGDWHAAGGEVVWRLSPVLLVAFPIGMRLLWDVRAARLALSVLLLAVAAWATAFAVQQTQAWTLTPLERTLLQAGCTLLGDWSLCWGLTLYARHVLLDAQGLLKAGRRKKRRLQVVAAPDSDRSHEGDLVQPAPQRAPLTPSTSSPDTSRSATPSQPTLAPSTVVSTTASKPATTGKAKSGLGSFLRFGSRRPADAGDSDADDDRDSEADYSDPRSHDDAANAPRRLSKAERRQLRREQRRAA